MFSKIVVGVDGREGDNDAIALAQRLADTGAELVACNVVATGRVPSRGTNRDYEAALLDEAGERVADATTAIGGLTITPHAVIAPSPADGICDLAADEAADLVVVGSCHHSAFGRVFAGNDAGEIVRRAPCPVAIAPRGYADGAAEIDQIGVGYNESAESEYALALAIELRGRFQASVEVIEILSPPWPVEPRYTPPPPPLHKERTEAASRLRAHAGVDKGRVTVSYGGAVYELRELARRSQLLVIGARPRSAFGRWILGSTADALTHDLPCPLLTVPRVNVAVRSTATIA